MSPDPTPILACIAVVAAGLIILAAGLLGMRRQIRSWTASEVALRSATEASLREQLRRSLEREQVLCEEVERLVMALVESERRLELQTRNCACGSWAVRDD